MSRALAALMLVTTLYAQAPSYERGTRLITPELAADLEALVANDSSNADARETLVSYYSRTGDTGRTRPHALWLVENAPDRRNAGMATMMLLQADRTQTERLIRLWERHLLDRPNDLSVLSNGLMVLQRISFERAEEMLRTLRARPSTARALLDLGLGSLYGFAIAASEDIGTAQWPEDAKAMGQRIKPALLTSNDSCVVGFAGSAIAAMLTDPRFQLEDRATPEILTYARALLDRGMACAPRKGAFRNASKRLPKQPLGGGSTTTRLLEAMR